MDRFLSGLLAVDTSLKGGVPPGSLLEISGTTDSCKTALALWYCKSFQERTQESVMWICTEANINSSNLQWASLDMNRFLVGKQIPGLSALDLATISIQEGIRLIVIDSVSALASDNPGARLNSVISTGLPTLSRVVRDNDALVILTNQERFLPGGRAVYTTGSGRTMNRLLDIRMKLKRGENLYRGGVNVGVRVHYDVQKNGDNMNDWNGIGRFTCLWQDGLRDLKNMEKE